MEAVFRAEAEQHGLAAEENHGKLRVAVFEREVNVAGGRWTVVGNLALDPDVAVVFLDEFAHQANEFAHRPDAAGGTRLLEAEIELGLEWIANGHYVQV